jgi:3-isopropylmalate dehydratase small subunit
LEEAFEVSKIEGKITQHDELEVDISKFIVKNIRTRRSFQAKKVLAFMQRMSLEGGLFEYFKRYKQFLWMRY